MSFSTDRYETNIEWCSIVDGQPTDWRVLKHKIEHSLICDSVVAVQTDKNSILLVGGKAPDKDNKTFKKQVTEFRPLGSAKCSVKGLVDQISQVKKLGHAIY